MLKYDLIALHMHHDCMKKKKLKKWLCEMEMKMKRPRDDKTENKRKIRNGMTLEMVN